MSKIFSSSFSDSYQVAREKFLSAAQQREALIEHCTHPRERGADGEDIAIDAVSVGSSDAKKLLIVTSGTHGIEGFCGSAIQSMLLQDEDIFTRLRSGGVALLLVHAVNPYGFSHLRRVNEDNVDLNRNFLNFGKELPVDRRYSEVHEIALPEKWPPNAGNIASIDSYKANYGARAFQAAVMRGQNTHPDGVCYSGRSETWSNTTLRALLRKYGSTRSHIAWIDIHTGLGPSGHGEKIFAGRNDPTELARARKYWGADVFSLFAGDSLSSAVRGNATSSVYDECPQASCVSMGLEFGTVEIDSMLRALRGDQWLSNHSAASKVLHRSIKRELRHAFYVNSPEWRGMVLGQGRVAALQGVCALSEETA